MTSLEEFDFVIDKFIREFVDDTIVSFAVEIKNTINMKACIRNERYDM